MAIITKAIRLETTQQNLIQAVIAKQNDCNSRFLKVTFLDEGTVIPLESSSKVTINAERKDGESKSFEGVINDDDTATLPLHSWILELDGVANCDISIIGANGSRLTTTTFVVKVEKAACSSDDISNDPQYDVLANLIAETQNFSSAIKETVSGNPIRLDYVSPLEHEMAVKLSFEPYRKTGSPLLNSTGEENVYEFHSNGNKYLTDTFVTVEIATETDLSFSDGSYFSTYNEDICQLNTFASEGETVCLCTVDGITYMYKTTETEATLQRYGKNLLPKDYFCHFPDKDDTQCFIYGMQHGTYTLSGWVTKYPDDTSTATRLKLVIYYKDGTTNLLFVGMDIECAECDGVPRYKEGSITTDFTKEIDRIQVALDYSVRNNPNRIAENVMLEFGSTATEFEPYIEPTTYTADENGNVAVPSLYPTTTLVADSGVTISAEYNADTKKYIDKKFAELAALIVNS